MSCKRLLYLTGILWLLLLHVAPLSAAELTSVAGVPVPPSVEVEGNELVLNGVGIRKATLFKIKVYVAALYAAEKTNSAEELLKSGAPRVLTMQFVRNVSREKLQDGWQTGFSSAPSYSPELDGHIKRFNAAMKEMTEGDRIELTFLSSGVNMKVGGEKFSVEGKEFARALLEIWLGPHPPNQSLKEGLLGRG